MKLTLAILVFLGSLSVAPPKVNNFRLKNLDNRTTTYKDIKGDTYTVIDFWATWCKPCIKSIPKLVEISKEFETEGVNFVGISIDSPRNQAKVKPFVRSLGVEYDVLLDPNSEVMGRLGVQAVPTLLIINQDDEIIYFHEGYKPGEEVEIREKILSLLEE
ncbi:MAG: TlpA family protein disulfide reductase [Balneola sp.]|nr:MAG: TlpA family protein disulfide reductase [Balneola sp.]